MFFIGNSRGHRAARFGAAAAVVVGLFVAGSCGKKKSSGESVATGKLALSVAAVNANTDGASSFALNSREFAPQAAQPESIASGAPDSLELSILSMDLQSESGSQVNIFKSDSGKPIKIEGSQIDLSQLFTTYDCYKADGTPVTLAAGQTCKCGVDQSGALIAPQADGTCKLKNDAGELVEITEPAGLVDVAAQTFKSLRVSFAPKAKIKGCVSATFKTTTGTTSNGSTGAQTYCTRTDLASTNESITPQHTAFKNVSAQETEIYLNKSWEQKTQNLQLDFPIAGGLKIAEGEKSNLSMVIDVNRMLRFYNKGRSDQGPNPGFPTTRAYFFTTVFEDSLFVFAGKAGSVRGYSWQTDTCKGTFANSYTSCPTSTMAVDGWLTLILDAQGVPFAASVMPDDDNNFTTLKGSNRKQAIGIDATMIKKNTDNSYDVSVSLGTDADPVIYKIDLSKTLGTSQETDYRGISGNFGGSSTEDTFGRIKLTRGL